MLSCFFPNQRCYKASCFCLSNHGVLVCRVQWESSDWARILCLFVHSERHRQLIQLLSEIGQLPDAARVLAPSSETQVHARTSTWPAWLLPPHRPLLLGPGKRVSFIHSWIDMCIFSSISYSLISATAFLSLFWPCDACPDSPVDSVRLRAKVP